MDLLLLLLCVFVFALIIGSAVVVDFYCSCRESKVGVRCEVVVIGKYCYEFM